MILWGSRMGSEAPEDNTSSEASSSSPLKSKRSKPAWKVALGDVVVFAPELGFHVKALKDETPDTARVAAQIEAQLGELRDLYRQAAEENPNLMGGITLQLNVGGGGEVTNVREIGSRIPDGEFRKSVLEAASKWNFPDLIVSPVVITCPLVLVREGMDITTVLTWEKTLGMIEDKPVVARAAQTAEPKRAAPPQVHSVLQSPAATPAQPKPAGRSNSNLFEIKASTPIRKEPSYKSSSISQAHRGSRMVVVGVHGEWLEVLTNGTSGYIRREFAAPVE